MDDGTNINYCTTGNGGHVVLLLPGALGTGRSDFTPQLEGLNSMGKLTLVAWDPPGYGKSRPPNRTFPPNFFERDAQAAMKFMQSIGHDKFSVLGWSGTYLLTLKLPTFLYFRPIKMHSLVVFDWSKLQKSEAKKRQTGRFFNKRSYIPCF